MTTGITPPTLVGDISNLKKRVTDLERKLDALSRNTPLLGIPFSLAGGIYTSESPPWTSPVEVRIANVVVLLGTAGSTATTIQIKVNDVIRKTLIVNAGEESRIFTTSIQISPDQDRVTVACATAGMGAEDLDVILRLR